MTAAQLIARLELCGPNTEVAIQIGENDPVALQYVEEKETAGQKEQVILSHEEV